GMNCKPSNNSNKKLVQARLPFKRLNPELKENQSHKRPCAHACPDVELSERENENESSPLLLCTGPPLVNGRGPLDGFLSRKRQVSTDENMVIDLTEEDVASVKPSIINPPKTQTVDSIPVDDDVTPEDMQNGQTSTSVLDTTQESECEAQAQNESQNVSSLVNESLLSNSPDGSMSESSPEKSQTEDPTPTEPNTTPKIPAEKKTKRRSLKSLQEQEEKRLEKERLKDEAKAAKEKKKEDARKQKEEREREKREKKERDERERKEKKEKEDKEKAERLKAKEEQRKTKLEYVICIAWIKSHLGLNLTMFRLKAEKADITRFLQKPKTQLAPKTLSAACGKFAPFEIKENMFLAPLTRVQFEDSDLEKLDEYLLNPDQKISGLKDWINQKPRCSGPTKTRKTDSPGDCKAVESPISDGVPDRSCHGPMKLLQFRENYRPAYWGTWSKKSSHISARCPFRQDKDLLDYEVDSDEEWEEEEPGESLSHSEGEDEEEGGEEDGEDDDGFFVPHGYLSDDEGALEEEDGGDLEKQKLQQKLKAKEWDELMSSKKKMKQLEPVVRGCVWEGQSQASELFHAYALCLIEPLVKVDTSPSPEEQLLKSQQETQLLGQLLPLLHGNVNSSKTIITEFQEFCRQQSSPSSPPTLYSNLLIQYYTFSLARLKLRRLIKNSAVYEKRSVYKRCCWYVHTEVLSQFGQVALPVPCQWTYLTTGAKEEAREEPQAATGSVGNSPPHHRALLTMKSSLTCVFICQQEAMEADGFQADTEEDDEDCVIVSTTKGGGKFGGFLKDGQQWPLC
uniref:Chromatin assembly factor 1, subunit A (p150) n=1 Tax=Neogobius melanostomus TaxID=47308 RepID=A0A8C6TFY1_9GOBI